MFCIWNFNNLTCILLTRVTEHLSICRRSIPLLRRNGAPFSELIVPQLAIPTPFYISYPHMYYQHNLYHLTHVAYQACSADETFTKCPMEFHPKPISKIRENLPMYFGSYRTSHLILLQCVPLAHSSNSQIVHHYLIIQSKFDCFITKQ